MRKIILVARRDEDTGELGLVIKGAHGYQVNSATEGLLIAHDLIEHQNGLEALGRIDDELEALGAIWMCRGRHGDLRRDHVGSAHSVEANIASDVTRMAVDLLHGQETCRDAPRTKPHDHDDAFNEIINIARREVPAEFGEPLTSEQMTTLRYYYKNALGYMRIGARKLMKRFSGQYDANNIFWLIAEACDGVTKGKSLARGELYEGAEYWLTYGYRDGQWQARCEEAWELP